MFSLSEKVNGAVSVKYQLPGEDPDPDTLITVADDNDIIHLFEEYFTHLRKTTTPIKTYRLQVYLFRADEDAYTAEDIVAEARYMSGVTVPLSGASSLIHSLRCGTAGLETDPESDAMSGPTQSELAALELACEQEDQMFMEDAVEDTELAWEAGFKAGQEAAVLANEDEWKVILNRRMARLARVASSYMLGDGWTDARRGWSDFSGGRASPAVLQQGGGGGGYPQSFDSGAAAAAAAAAATEVSGLAAARGNNGSASRLQQQSGYPPLPQHVQQQQQQQRSNEYAPSEQPDADPNFRSMFESKYEVSPPASKPESPAPSSNRPSPPLASNHPAVAPSPTSLLPNRISIFGDDVTLAEEFAAAEAVGATRPINLPSHISEFGDDEDSLLLGTNHNSVAGSVGNNNNLMNIHNDQGGVMNMMLAAAAAVPLPPTRPPSYAAPGGGGIGDDPLNTGAAAAAAALTRTLSTEETLRNAPRIDSSAVSVVAKIGEGAFGEVSLCECPTYGRVAVKWIKPTRAERHWANFWHEADVMSRLNHPNVLRFFGLVVQKNMVVGIMTEFAAQGSLAALLRSGVGFIPLRRRAQIALHAANGMAYLHSQKVVHFDVKPDNLLVDGDWTSPSGPVVKVADFGLSVVKYNTFCSDVQDLRGTLPYMAPEMVLDHRHVTEAADVWSLGVVFWELLTLQVPYADMPPASLLGALSANKLRLPLPDWCEPEWRALMEACWVQDPTLRPTCKQLAQQLERIRDAAPMV